MRILSVLLVAVLSLLHISNAYNYDRISYDALINEMERELAARQLEAAAFERRMRRSSEKKSYPRNCYFSPIQCLFTREQ